MRNRPAGSILEGKSSELARRSAAGELDLVLAEARAAGLWRFDTRS